MLTISVANRFNRNKYAAFKNQAPHELARAEVIDVLGNDDFLREVAVTRKTSGRKAGGQPAPGGQVDSTHDVAEVTHGRRFAAGTAYLTFMHVFDDNLAAASECVCRRSEGYGEQENHAGQAESIGFYCLRCTHVLSPALIVRMSVQNSKYAESRPC